MGEGDEQRKRSEKVEIRKQKELGQSTLEITQKASGGGAWRTGRECWRWGWEAREPDSGDHIGGQLVKDFGTHSKSIQSLDHSSVQLEAPKQKPKLHFLSLGEHMLIDKESAGKPTVRYLGFLHKWCPFTSVSICIFILCPWRPLLLSLNIKVDLKNCISLSNDCIQIIILWPLGTHDQFL